MKNSLKYHTPAIAYAALIIVVSSIESLSAPQIDWLSTDKLAHVVEYALFAFLFYRSFFRANRKPTTVTLFMRDYPADSLSVWRFSNSGADSAELSRSILRRVISKMTTPPPKTSATTSSASGGSVTTRPATTDTCCGRTASR